MSEAFITHACVHMHARTHAHAHKHTHAPTHTSPPNVMHVSVVHRQSCKQQVHQLNPTLQCTVARTSKMHIYMQTKVHTYIHNQAGFAACVGWPTGYKVRD